VKDRSLKSSNRRRVLNLGSLSAASLVALGLTRLPRHTALGQSELAPRMMDVRPKIVAFIGALFGNELSAPDIDDLANRLAYGFAKSDSFRRDCVFLARYLDESARDRGTSSFESCSDAQKDGIVDAIMRIDAHSAVARLLARSARTERDYYHMRSSTIGRLSWIYRHSSAAWRARGYGRWPGIAGDWHEVLRPGPGYP
jgi:hypothetical protein